MKYLSYLGETVLTTDRVASVIVDYLRALVIDKSSDVIDIPVLRDDIESVATLLVGPSSQLMMVEARGAETPLNDELPIARMRNKIAALGPHRAGPSESFIADDRALTYDYL